MFLLLFIFHTHTKRSNSLQQAKSDTSILCLYIWLPQTFWPVRKRAERQENLGRQAISFTRLQSHDENFEIPPYPPSTPLPVMRYFSKLQGLVCKRRHSCKVISLPMLSNIYLFMYNATNLVVLSPGNLYHNWIEKLQIMSAYLIILNYRNLVNVITPSASLICLLCVIFCAIGSVVFLLIRNLYWSLYNDAS